MKAMTTIKRLLTGTRAVASSLRKRRSGCSGVGSVSIIETAAVLAISGIVVGTGLSPIISTVDEANIRAAGEDAKVIAEGVLAFYKDNSIFPLFKDGDLTGPNADFFNNLVSTNGTYATDQTGTWDIPASPTPYASGSSLFGHQVAATDDTIEGHLITNQINRTSTDGGLTFTGTGEYAERGTIPGDAQRGWNGPYAVNLSLTDPWGNKFVVNVRKLHVKHFAEINAIETLPDIAVMVLSGGPNRAIETSDSQASSVFNVQGDDILFRVK